MTSSFGKAAAAILLCGGLLSGCTGGQESHAAEEQTPKKNGIPAVTTAPPAQPPVDARAALKSISAVIPIYAGAKYRDDLTRPVRPDRRGLHAGHRRLVPAGLPLLHHLPGTVPRLPGAVAVSRPADVAHAGSAAQPGHAGPVHPRRHAEAGSQTGHASGRRNGGRAEDGHPLRHHPAADHDERSPDPEGGGGFSECAGSRVVLRGFSVLGSRLSVVGYQLSVVGYQLSVVGCQLSVD